MEHLRMCVICRNRFEQQKLIRLQCFDNSLVLFTGSKRSFYICSACIKEDIKKLDKHFSRVCKGKVKNLSEFISRSNNLC